MITPVNQFNTNEENVNKLIRILIDLISDLLNNKASLMDVNISYDKSIIRSYNNTIIERELTGEEHYNIDILQRWLLIVQHQV
jgi:hypothetical protein